MTDGTIELQEPQLENAGMPQGLFLRRRAIPRPDGSGNYGLEDMHMGAELDIFGKVMRIYGATTSCGHRWRAHRAHPVVQQCPHPSSPRTWW